MGREAGRERVRAGSIMSQDSIWSDEREERAMMKSGKTKVRGEHESGKGDEVSMRKSSHHVSIGIVLTQGWEVVR